MESINSSFYQDIEGLRKKLLDMGMRNNLLNFKERKASISIFEEDIGELFNILVVNEKSMTFDFIDEEADAGHHKEWVRPEGEVPSKYTDLKLQTRYDEKELKTRLNKSYRSGKTILEEQGYNNLFLALGFLKWKEAEVEETFHKAPLILVPVELTQKSIGKPYKLSYNLDEIRPNITLQFKLKNQGIDLPIFNENNPLETKKDVYDYLDSVKAAIENKEGWTLLEDIYISSFSFRKFVMYQDLNPDNWHEGFINNDGLNSIINPQEEDNYYEDYEDFPKAPVKYEDVFHVVDADSSQIAVLEEAKRGHNLVVQGPPGTGKSQTIVNLIAELMANGKSILFVSEKMAALDVVKRRLDDINLGQGCLELHSTKTKKRDVLDELDKTLRMQRVTLNQRDEFYNIESTRENLNKYAKIIFSPFGKSNYTTYDLYGMVELNKQELEEKNQKILKLNMDNLEQYNTAEIGASITNLEELSKYYERSAPIKENEWENTSPEELTLQQIEEIHEILKDNSNLIGKCNELNNILDNLSFYKKFNSFDNYNFDESLLEFFDQKLKPLKFEEKKILNDLISKLKNFQKKSKGIELKLLNNDLNLKYYEICSISLSFKSIEFKENALELDLKKIIDSFSEYKTKIDNTYFKDALNDLTLKEKLEFFKNGLNSKSPDANFTIASEDLHNYYGPVSDEEELISDFEDLIKWNDELNNIKKSLSPYLKKELTNDEIIVEGYRLLNMNKLLNQFHDDVSNLIPKEKHDSESIKKEIFKFLEIRGLESYIKNHETIANEYFGVSWQGINSNIEKLESKLKMFEDYMNLIEDGTFDDKTIEFLEVDSNLEDTKNNIQVLNSNISQIKNNFVSLIELLKFDGFTFSDINEKTLRELQEFNQHLLDNFDGLNNYRVFKKNALEYSNSLTFDLIEHMKNDEISIDSVIPLFRYNFANNALNQLFAKNKILDNFNAKTQDDLVEKFKKYDKDILKFNQTRVIEILGNNRPSIEEVSNRKSPLGILRNEIAKQRRIKSLRTIFKLCKDVIVQIKPCFMMSPVSIAQYLDPKAYESFFDYIIFDEASQVRVEDALGAFIRGKHYIVMGDNKQLPPTNFFNSDDNFEEDGSTDLIDAQSILDVCDNSFKRKMLKWHYRSRHESLIDVSNTEFYNNELYVYPSPMQSSEELGLKFEYNPENYYDYGGSSQNLGEATDIVNYAISHFKKYPDKSLGIGTFSVKQQQAIYDILEEKIRDHPEVENFFNETGANGFFVKNLENIQGDERDVILISVGYGKDRNGKFRQNFGPLNRDGGERRLNVLITRAREKCVVFSNFKADDIRISISSSRGLKALKTFLYYAEKKEFPKNYITGEDFDSPFEESVYKFLTNHGYDVEKQVGCIGYKIDLAIVDPDNRGRYVLAIECDGASYHSSASARDRDRLRQQVLEGLGWQFHRIWSTDWFINRKNAEKSLLKAVEYHIKHKDDETKGNQISDYAPEVSRTLPQVEKEEDKYIPYIKIDTDLLNRRLSYTPLHNIITDIIDTESPIHIEEYYDIMKDVLKRKKTSDFKNQMKVWLIKNSNVKQKGNFIYSTNNAKIEARKREKPKIDRIAPEEINDAILKTLKYNISLPKEDIPKEASKFLGFKKLNKNAKNTFLKHIDILENERKIKFEDWAYSLSKGVEK